MASFRIAARFWLPAPRAAWAAWPSHSSPGWVTRWSLPPGKPDRKQFLLDIGAAEVVSRGEVDDSGGRPLLAERWAGVVDTAGGNILATGIKATRSRGIVTCCGLVASAELSVSVFPFILRGVSLTGIDSAECPMPERTSLWKKIAGPWKIDALDDPGNGTHA